MTTTAATTTIGCDSRNMRKPLPVLPEEFTREQPDVEKAYVGVLKEKRAASRVIASLTRDMPCPRHLKRCHGLRVYLAALDRLPEGVDGPESLRRHLQLQCGLELELLEDELEVVDVPIGPAHTRAQMQAATAIWPVHFHPEPRIEALLSGTALDASELAVLEACARLAVQATQKYSNARSSCAGAAAILDPRKGEPRLLVLAAADYDRHPLWHPAMLAVDLIARRQGGGAWPLDIKDNDCEDDEPSSRSKRLCLRNSEESRPLLFPPDLRLEPESLKLLTPSDDEDNNKDVYLCTGYWAVLVQEPCAMCAMALLHSRVAKVFYGASNPEAGVLGSRALLHFVPGLNHRYEVWSGLLETECLGVLDKTRNKIVD